ncbi:hypothetical protein ISF_01803 [Cordyceps fumosorosea ARSEF 2679]|uniref:Uncharacterized protein n=1 Tax=Cordyceps fumosorosea (strain ARSEF 2679) TaxID=1081104 RepID=A0A162JMY0_CORFA|nr:hypothetical protein ISF_01803 [Cordyceps fumosorosea ARSEF 2679]OAA71252.1 hypothetical protein ISF_01803 [Cordyceps fumosorosea ARSEF 2679]
MSAEALEFLIENPNMIERVCDNAKPFLFLGSNHESVMHYSPHQNVSWQTVYSPWKTGFLQVGLGCICAISKKRGCTRLTSIIPPFTMCSPGAQKLLDELSFIPGAMFCSDIAERLRALLRYAMPRAAENQIMLSPYLRAIFDDGQFGTYTKCSVHFSVHWMPMFRMHPNTLVGGDTNRSHLEYILELDQGYLKLRDMVLETDAVTKETIPNGYQCSVTHHNYQNAENMFVLLAFRWLITMASCLAGSMGIGTDREDISTEWEEIIRYESESESEEQTSPVQPNTILTITTLVALVALVAIITR